jgi:hypothetical protein
VVLGPPILPLLAWCEGRRARGVAWQYGDEDQREGGGANLQHEEREGMLGIDLAL